MASPFTSAARIRTGGVVLVLVSLLAAGAVPSAAAEPGDRTAMRPAGAQALAAAARLDAFHGRPGGSATSGPSFLQAGCYQDPAGDTFDADSESSEPVPQPRADVTEFCVDFQAELDLTVAVTEPTDPLTDPSWANENTFVGWALDTDGEDDTEYAVVFFVEQSEVRVQVIRADEAMTCDLDGALDGDRYVMSIPGPCLGRPTEVRFRSLVFYDDGSLTAADIAPNDTLYEGPLARTLPPVEPQCDAPDDGRSTAELSVLRVRCGGGATDPVLQAVAVSESLFEQYGADHAIIARSNDFPDALAGSALGFGVAPLLFTYAPDEPDVDPNRLAPATRAELLRVLQPGPEQVVYLLGGTQAIAPGVEQELADLGYAVQRLSGPRREDTAAAISREVRNVIARYPGFPDLKAVFVATADNWPDAVTAGSVASYYGFPVLLTPGPRPAGSPNEQDGRQLYAGTAAALTELAPDFVYILGGRAAISEEVGAQLREFVTDNTRPAAVCDTATCRIGGSTRDGTAVRIAALMRRLLQQTGSNGLTDPTADVAVAVNVRQDGGFAHILSSSAVTGRLAGVFIPVEEGSAGTFVTPCTSLYLRDTLSGMLQELRIAGDTDVISDATADQLALLAQGQGETGTCA